MAINQCIFNGRIPFDIKFFGDEEKPMALFTLAVKRNFKKADEKYYPDDLLPMKAFGNSAKYMKNYIEKGCSVVISARAVLDDAYTDKEGNEVPQKISFIVDQINQVGKKESGGGEKNESTASEPKKKSLTKKAASPF